MSVYNAQFFRLDLRLLDHGEFLAFMKTPRMAVYFQLVRYIWRGRSAHPIERVNQLRGEGLLVAAVDREVLASKLEVQKTYVSRMLRKLEEEGLIRRVRTGRQSVFILGEWEDRSARGDGSYLVEILYLHQRFGPDGGPQIRLDEGSGESSEVDGPSTSEVRGRSGRSGEVDSESTSEVHQSEHRGSEVDSESTSEVDSEFTSEVTRSHPRSSEVHSQSTSEVDSESTSILNRKERYISDLSFSSLSEGDAEAAAEIQRVLTSYGREPPRDARTAARWLALCGGSLALVLSCLHRLGRQGHLEDKPDPYIVATLERAGRQAAAERVRHEEDDDDDGVYVVR